MSTPMIEKVRNATGGTLPLVLTVSECKALLAEIAPTPPRRLREHKGVVYDATASKAYPWCRGDDVYASAAAVIAHSADDLTDADHAALLALRDDPYEPVETLEEVVEDWYWSTPFASLPSDARAKLCTRLRAHLSQQTPTLTAGEHIAALVAMGAERREVNVNASVRGSWGKIEPAYRDALILPPEVSP